ncbi:MAG: hypothetical protein ABR577_18290 [Pyrinomonadaceae bacterium]
MFLNDALADGEAETRAAFFVGNEERLEDVPELIAHLLLQRAVERGETKQNATTRFTPEAMRHRCIMLLCSIYYTSACSYIESRS